MNLELIFTHILYSSLIGSLMVIVLLIIKKLFPNRFSPRFIHIIWVLILIRFLMPLDIANPLNSVKINPPGQFFPYQVAEELEGNETNLIRPDAVETDNTNITDQNNWSGLYLNMFSRIWLGGFILFFSFMVYTTMRFKYQTRKRNLVEDAEVLFLLKQVSGKLGITRNIPVYLHPSIKNPGIVGVIKPCIYLPEDIFTQINLEQLEHVLLHELVHYKRGDLVYNLGVILAGLVHWFNPLVWLAVREMRHDREMATDAYVLEILGEQEVIPYGMTIINLASIFAHRSKQINLVSFSENYTQVERRINMIKNYKIGSYKVSLVGIVILILIGIVTLTTLGSSPYKAPAPINAIQGQLVLIDPGHGGEDFGAVYPINSESQLKEKDINLDIALKLKPMLEESGVKVIMSRQDDKTVALDDRVEWANGQEAALLVNIHNNNHPEASTNGTIIYYQRDSEKDSENLSEKAAQIIQGKLVQELETTDLGYKPVKLRMLDETIMPAISTEIAFISNDSDRGKLESEDFRIKAAQALHDGIVEFLYTMESGQK